MRLLKLLDHVLFDRSTVKWERIVVEIQQVNVMVWVKIWYVQNIYDIHNNKNDRHDITEILLKVALNTINQTKPTV
jgi:hypothetical protein